MRVFNTQLLSGLLFGLLVTLGNIAFGQTYSSSPNLAIPDNTPAGVDDMISIPVYQTDVITDLNVDLDIDHTWVGDLTVTLEHVATGTVVTLIEAPGAPPTSESCSGDNIDATMDDGAATPVESECDTPSVPAISGSFQPNGLLASFNNETLAGDWVLNVADNGTGDIGSLVSWTLNFTSIPGIPFNDECQNAIALECGDDTTGTTTNAIIDFPGTPACSTSVVSGGVWYTVQGNGGSITASLCNPGTTYDTRLNIYRGSCDSLVCVTGDDDACGFAGPSEVTWVSDPCVTYYILVHGFTGQTGDFELSITCTDAPTTLIADAGPDKEFCFDNGSTTDTLEGSASGGHYLFPYSYQWSPSAGLDDPMKARPEVGGPGLTPGTYTYTLTVTDTCGVTATDEVVVEVYENPVPSVDDIAFCFDESTAVLNASVSGGTAPYSYSWSPAANLSSTIVEDPTFTAPAPGTYTYTLTVTDDNGCQGTDDVTITVWPEPIADAGDPDTAICEGQALVIGGMPTATGGTPPYTYSWAPNYRISSTSDANPSVDPLVTTTYTVTVTDVNGCNDSDTIRVKVFPETPVSFTGLDAEYCFSDPCATLMGSPMGGTFTGPGITDPNGTFCPATAGAGTHDIIYTYTDVNGCTYSDTQSTTVNPEITVDAGADTTICNNVSINLGGSPTASGGTAPLTYSWMPTDYLDDPTSANPLFTPTAIPNYSYTVTVTDAEGCSVSDVINITTIPAPAADAGEDVETCADCPGVTLGGYPTATDGAGTLDYSYSWVPVTGLNDPTDANPIATPAATTTYTVTVTDNANGCTDMDEVTVTVNPLPTVEIVGLASSYCSNGDIVTLTGSPAGGTFYGEGVTGSTSTEVFKLCYGGAPVSIPDNALPVNIILNGGDIQGESLGDDVVLDSVDLRINHTWVGDLSVTLESPNGTNVVLVDRPGVPASTFGCDEDNIITTFITGTGNSVENECNSYLPAIHGTFTAHSGFDLNNLNDGSDPNGAWTLEITDISAGELGEFIDATLYFSSEGASSATAELDPSLPTADTTTIYYAYTDENGCKNVVSQTVDIFDPPVVNAGADQTICSNETATLGGNTVAVGNGPFTYAWAPSANLDDATAENPEFTPAGPGVTTFTVTVTDVNGCVDFDVTTVTVNEAPVADAGTDKVICADGSVELGGSPTASSGTPPYTYSWSPGLGLSSTSAANPTFTPVGPATYNYTVTVTDANGCEDFDEVEILVHPLPSVDAGNDLSVCANESIAIGQGVTASGNGPLTYSWSPSANLDDPTLLNPTYTPTSVGTVAFTITVTDANGCTNTDVINVESLEIPTVDAGADRTICENDTIFLGGSPTASSPSNLFTYSWTPAGNLDDATIANPMVTWLSNTTTFTVTVSDNATGCVNSDEVTITVNPLPIVTISGLVDEYCIDDDTDYVVSGSPEGGDFDNSSLTLSTFAYGGNVFSRSFTMTPVAIPDNDPAGVTLSQTVSVPGTSLGNDISLDSVHVVMDHNGVGDLYFNIENPNGTKADLLDHPSPSFRDDVDATFEWGTGNPATNAVFPYPAIRGTFTAINGDDLNNLNDGSDPNGQWQFFVSDDAAFDDGDVDEVILYFSGPSRRFNPSIAGLGVHTIIYTYTDANGCTNADTQDVLVNPLPEPEFTGLEAVYCADDAPDTLSGTPIGGTFAGNGVFSFTAGDPADCSYTLEMSDSWGDGWNGASLDVFVDGAFAGNYTVPSGTFNTGTFLVEDGSTIELFYTGGSFDSEVSYDLLDPNGSVVFSNSNPADGLNFSGTSTTSGCGLQFAFDPVAAGAGDHTVYYVYVDSNGCSNVDSQTTTVLTPLVVDAGDDAQICAYPNETVVLGGSPTASGSEGTYTYNWSPVTNLDDATSPNPVFTQTTVGDFSYTLTVTDGEGCMATDDINIRVDSVPVVSFTGLDSAYCVNAAPDTLIGSPDSNGTGEFAGPGVITVSGGGSGGGGGPGACTPQTPLTTTFIENNGQDGNMFDIVALNDVEINSFDVHLDGGSATFEIYTKTGSHQGFETNAGAWTLIATTSVAGQGNGVPTPLNLNLSVPIQAGNTQAFYVTTLSTTIEYTNGNNLGSVYAQDANIQFLQGVGKAYPFGGTFSPRIWNGNIIYCTPGPSANNAPANPNVNCVYELEMNDSWGDGWNGAYLEVELDGNVIGTYSAYDNGSTADIPVVDGASLSLNYTPGFFENEVSYTLRDASGSVIFSDGPFPSTGNVFNTTASAAGCAYAPFYDQSGRETDPTLGNTNIFSFHNTPTGATGNAGVLTAESIGDLNFSTEIWYIRDEAGAVVGTVGGPGNPQCSGAAFGTFPLSDADINTWAADGVIEFTVTDEFGGINESLCNDDYFDLRLEYTASTDEITLFHPDSAGVGTHWVTYTFTDDNGCIGVDSQQVTVHPLAELVLEPDTAVCRNEPVNLTAQALGTPGPFIYTWAPADGLNTTTGDSVIATPDSTTMYTVTVTDGRGCVQTDSIQLVIYQLPEVTIRPVVGSDSVCYQEEVCLWADVLDVVENAPVPELIYYKFDQSGGSSVDNLASSPVGNNPAPIQGNLVQGDNGQFGSALRGTRSSSASNFVNSGWSTDLGDGDWTISFWTHRLPWNLNTFGIFGDPNAAIQCVVSGGGAAPGGVVLTGSFPQVTVPAVSFGPSVVTFVYDSVAFEIKAYRDGQLLSSTSTNGPIDITGNGPFKVGGTGTIDGLADGQLLDEFRVYNRALSDQEVAATAFEELGDSTGLTYVWSNGAPDNDTICFTATMSETIIVDVIDANGCIGSDTFELTVNPEIVANAGLDTAICQGSEIVLGGNPTGLGGTGELSYEWAPNEQLSDPNVANPIATPLINTTYTVTVTDELECSWTDEIEITVNKNPMADAGNDLEICLGDTVVIGGTPAATGGMGPYTYNWAPATDISDPSVANPSVYPDADAQYVLTVSDANGCSDDSIMKVIVRPLPDVTITAAGPYCENDMAVMLTAGSTGGTWSGTGIVDASTGMFDPSVAGAGTHTITFSNTTQFGCTDNSSIDIQVNAIPEPEITGDLSYCLSQAPVVLTASPAGGTWSGNGIIDASTGTFDPNRAGIGSHQVVYQFTDSVGCVGFDTAMVSVSEAPDVSIEPVETFCQSDDAVSLVGSPAGGTWSGNGITDPNAGTFDPSAAGVGTHVVTYTYTDPIGCTVSADITIEVEGIANLSITPAGPFCQEGGNTVLAASVGGGYWSGPGIVNPLIGEFNPTAAGPGNHTITYSVTEPNGCVTITEEQISVNASPSATISQAGPFCADAPSVTLQAATAGGTWSGNGITNSAAGTFDPAVAGAGTHIITYEVTDVNGCFNTGTSVIKVNELPVASGSVKDVSCDGFSDGAVEVDVEGGAPPYSYDWSNGEVTQDLDEITAGTYTFTVTDAKGCANTATFEVGTASGVISASAVVINATTPVYNNGSIDVTISGGVPPYSYDWSNGAESEDVNGLRPDEYTLVVTDDLGCSEEFVFNVESDFGVGIDEEELSNRVDLFPNPTKDVINVSIDLGRNAADFNMTVFDMLGRKVHEVHSSIDKAYQKSINVESWASGQYMIRFDIDGQLVTKKFVITK